MTCIHIPGGIVCVTGHDPVDLTRFGSAVMCEFHHHIGPRFETKQGREIVNPSPKTWAAFEAWRKEGKP